MRSTKEIAKLLKTEFNCDDCYNEPYSGLCSALGSLEISIVEYENFKEVLNKELLKKKWGYTYSRTVNSFDRIEITNFNMDDCYIWIPYSKKYRNKFLDKLINV